MPHPISRRWTKSGVQITSEHPQLGPIDRGRVMLVRDRVDGAGAFMVWQTIDSDYVSSELLIAADYLSAEQVLLAQTAWAEEPAGPNDFDG